MFMRGKERERPYRGYEGRANVPLFWPLWFLVSRSRLQPSFWKLRTRPPLSLMLGKPRQPLLKDRTRFSLTLFSYRGNFLKGSSYGLWSLNEGQEDAPISTSACTPMDDVMAFQTSRCRFNAKSVFFVKRLLMQNTTTTVLTTVVHMYVIYYFYYTLVVVGDTIFATP